MNTRQYLRWISLALVFGAPSLLLSGCVGYVPGAKAHWDCRLRELCNRDGGVSVYERVEVTPQEFKKLGGLRESIPIPEEQKAPVDYPYFRRVVDTVLNEANPVVMRSETQVIRRSDKKVLGRSIVYWRRGGDLPTGIAHDSSFSCPESVSLTPQIFVVRSAR